MISSKSDRLWRSLFDCLFEIPRIKEKKYHWLYVAPIKSMTKLLEKAFKEAQKLSNNLQDEIARQLLEDIQNELNWQKTLSDPDIDLGIFEQMAQAAITEDDRGETEAKGFGQE